MQMICLAVIPVSLATLVGTAMGQPLPTLRYDPPANFYRSASTPPDTYESQEVNAAIQVYPFRAFRGDFLQAFRQGMFRDWLDVQHQETNVATPPSFSPANIPGAEAGIVGRFYESIAGTPKPHMRVALFASGAVAIVDVSANSDASWQRVWPAMQATLISLKVTPPNAVASGPATGSVGAPTSGAAARTTAGAVSGLFMGTKPRYMVDLQKSVGNGRWVTAAHWYLFSGDGRVHRGYDDPNAPGGDVRRFDFDEARRTDADNSGSYSVRGNQLIIEMGPQGTERIAVSFEPRRVVINSVVYHKQ
jgi:hypothetical protein